MARQVVKPALDNSSPINAGRQLLPNAGTAAAPRLAADSRTAVLGDLPE
jgi:hypothetical protein